MKIATTRASLLPALKRATRVANPNSTMPILSCVVLRAADGALTISATDLSLATTVAVDAEVKKPGVAVVDARTLYGLIERMPDGKVEVGLDGKALAVSAARVKASVAVVANGDRDFPAMPAPTLAMREVSEEEGTALAAMLAATAASVCDDDSRFHLTGCLWQQRGSAMRVVSTDGHRMHLAEHTFAEGAPAVGSKGIIVPRVGCGLIRAMLTAGGVCRLGIEDRYVFVDDGGGTVLAVKLIDGSFPPYEQIIPSHTTSATVDRAALADAVKRSALMCGETHGITFDLDAEELVVSATHPDKGNVSEEIGTSCGIDGRLRIGINPKYLGDALDSMSTESVSIEVGGPLDPVAIKPVGTGGFVAVLMPMRL